VTKPQDALEVERVGEGGGVIDVFELDSRNFLAICTFNLKSEMVSCDSNPV